MTLKLFDLQEVVNGYRLYIPYDERVLSGTKFHLFGKEIPVSIECTWIF